MNGIVFPTLPVVADAPLRFAPMIALATPGQGPSFELLLEQGGNMPLRPEPLEESSSDDDRGAPVATDGALLMQISGLVPAQPGLQPAPASGKPFDQRNAHAPVQVRTALVPNLSPNTVAVANPDPAGRAPSPVEVTVPDSAIPAVPATIAPKYSGTGTSVAVPEKASLPAPAMPPSDLPGAAVPASASREIPPPSSPGGQAERHAVEFPVHCAPSRSPASKSNATGHAEPQLAVRLPEAAISAVTNSRPPVPADDPSIPAEAVVDIVASTATPALEPLRAPNMRSVAPDRGFARDTADSAPALRPPPSQPDSAPPAKPDADVSNGQLVLPSQIADMGADSARAPEPAALAAARPEIVDRQLDMAREDLWLGELARDIVAFSGGKDALSFRLMPRSLGQLDVRVASSDEGLSIQMSASNEDARTIVAAAQPRLVEEIRSQGVRVADASVGHGGAEGRGGRPTDDQLPMIEIAQLPAEPESAPVSRAPDRGLFA